MPLYEYHCNKCGESFEVLQKFSDEPLTTHAKCGGPVERLLSAPALQFKGSGWYITDYAKSSGSNASHSNGSQGSEKSKESKDKTGSSSETPSSSSSTSESKSTSSDKK